MIERVEAALDKIRPFLKADGGDVRVIEITEDMVVKLELVGACESCPMSHMTMKAGIEEAIKRDLPEIKSVVAVNAETAV
jgi:Fe-S cluster biogenesis protein NfuA